MFKISAGLTVSFFLLFNFSLIAQSVEQTMEFAEKMFENGNFEEAKWAYERILFFDDGTYSSRSYANLAESYFITGDFYRAIPYFDLAYYASDDEKLKKEMLFSKVLCLILTGQSGQARIELLSIAEPQDTLWSNKYHFYKALSFFLMEDFKSSEQHFLSIKTLDDDLYAEWVNEMFLKNKSIDRKKPRTARTLSMIFPGLGQFYAGDVKGGLNSIMLTGGIFMLTYYTALNLSLLDASATYFPWLVRYYMGGYGNAAEAVRIRNEEKRTALLRDLIDRIEEEENMLTELSDKP